MASDAILVSSTGLRLFCRSLGQQILLWDRWPAGKESRYSAIECPNIDESVRHYTEAGFTQLKVPEGFAFDATHWQHLLVHNQQFVAPKLQHHYSSPLVPLLKIRNISLMDRVTLAHRSIFAALPVSPKT